MQMVKEKREKEKRGILHAEDANGAKIRMFWADRVYVPEGPAIVAWHEVPGNASLERTVP
jgi:hypothetical protein